MKIQEFRGKSAAELKDLIAGLKKELLNLRFQVATGELANTSRFREVRKAIARAETVKTEVAGAGKNNKKAA